MSEPVKSEPFFTSVPNMPNGEPFKLADFIPRTDPHSEQELKYIEKLVACYRENFPLADSMCTPAFLGELPMTFAEDLKDRLLGRKPWVLGFDIGNGKQILLLTTRFTLLF
ncbi:MAG TPA: hypothetical protein VH877_26115 [Polyangia bacterium]|nr:hypothetical protein [Polyangia bacterium]